MRVPALFDPEIFEANLFAKSFRPKKVGSTFAHRNNIVIFDGRAYHFFLAPHTTAIGIRRAAVAVVKELFPFLRRARL
jgi:hypothetical protein